ncbi:MAG: trehalase family glycosidase [Candidatus Xenobia bacterium]
MQIRDVGQTAPASRRSVAPQGGPRDSVTLGQPGDLPRIRRLPPAPPMPQVPGVSEQTMRDMTAYVQHEWQSLRRSVTSEQALHDSKVGGNVPLYVPAQLLATVTPICPQAVPLLAAVREKPGLLYVPNDFVVPGGRFNEQYGWDSYFTIRGLLEDGHTDLARDMVNNLMFEVKHYGKVLNANRSYYLGRSSPPFLSSCVMALYQKTGDKQLLLQALPIIKQEYETWRDRGPYGHLTDNGLSRYASDVGEKCPEVEPGYYDKLPTTPEFYRNDRAERESGWDMTDRYGYRCMDYNPVDLNCLLYKSERDIGDITRILGGSDAADWDNKADARRDQIQKLMWDPQQGIFCDYNPAQGKRSTYPSLATFVPLWTGVATPEQAKSVLDQLGLFEQPGGLMTSTQVSGKQWDAPYMWPPLNLMACEGLRRYGFNDDADRIEQKVLTCAARNFAESGTLFEKYDAVHASSHVPVGYGNQTGFGWTNAMVRVFTNDLLRRQAHS